MLPGGVMEVKMVALPAETVSAEAGSANPRRFISPTEVSLRWRGLNISVSKAGVLNFYEEVDLGI